MKNCIKCKRLRKIHCREHCKPCYVVLRRKDQLPLIPKSSEEEKKLKDKLRQASYRKSNKERNRIVQKAWRDKNREYINEYKRKYHATKDKERISNKLKLKRKTKEYRDLRRKQQKQRLIRDPLYRAKRALRKRLWEFKQRLGDLSQSEILGCSWGQFKVHIESLFQEGMTWNNYGKDGWEFDHIVPLCTAINLDDLKKLSHYTNIRPLWKKDNNLKSLEDIKLKPIRLD